ncbi:MAG TPA: SgcJ/EcaC family oxidoreductase [Vicinamibacterales bacterium]
MIALRALCITVLLVVPAASASAQGGDEKAIRDLVQRYTEAREKRDEQALVALFTEDADQLVSSGEWRRGRDAVVTGSLASSERTAGKRTFTVESVRLLAPGVAVADSRYEIAQTDGPVRRMWAAWILVRTPDGWKIAGIRNMLPASASR